jgi:hypothetical protein
MNDTISAVLREHADGDVHIERLVEVVPRPSGEVSVTLAVGEDVQHEAAGRVARSEALPSASELLDLQV